MKNKIKILVLLLITCLIVYFLGLRYYGKQQLIKAFDGSDIFLPKNRVLIDSVKVSDDVFYWFSYDLGTFGHSEDFISSGVLLKDVDTRNAFFSSGFMSSISVLNKDTLFIKLTTKEFRMDSSKLTIPIKIELESEGTQIMKRKRKNISIQEKL